VQVEIRLFLVAANPLIDEPLHNTAPDGVHPPPHPLATVTAFVVERVAPSSSVTVNETL
jgi:hypothetical protein